MNYINMIDLDSIPEEIFKFITISRSKDKIEIIGYPNSVVFINKSLQFKAVYIIPVDMLKRNLFDGFFEDISTLFRNLFDEVYIGGPKYEV